ncbi:DUF2158 domain-containing protein [Thalassospira sp.]|uniref:DUF2158 domain-containing protein n=1 Tax=Thalassospira sp. TaxID=1912094 RepID=UPI0032EE12BD
MSAEELKQGDTVGLKSGGPVMTIRWTQNENGEVEACCDWFDKSQKQETAVFPVSSLRKINL